MRHYQRSFPILLSIALVFAKVYGVPDGKHAVPSSAATLDATKVVIFTEEGTELILQSDLDRPGLTGAKKNLDELIFERLVYLDARHYKAVPDDDALDKYIGRVMRDNSLQLDDLKQMFTQAGFSYDEGREELRRLQSVSMMISNRIYAGIMVSRREVEAYHKEHPAWIEGELLISQAVVPYKGERETQRKQLRSPAKTVEWSEPFWIKPSELDEDRQFLADLSVGALSEPEETTHGFEFFHILDKKQGYQLSLDERYQDIADILARPKYEELLAKYKKTLMDGASIVYF